MDGINENASKGKGSAEKSHPTRGNALSSRVIMAKQYFLYGDENGKRIIDPKQLAEKVGCHVGSIFRHIATWRQEHQRMLVNRNGCEWMVALNEETLEEYKADVEFARNQKDELKHEIETVDQVEEYLRALLVKIDLSPKETDKALSMIGKFLETLGAKKYLREQWIKTEKFWIELSGMQSRMSVFQTYETEMMKAKARSDAKRSEDERDGQPETQRGGFFDVG